MTSPCSLNRCAVALLLARGVVAVRRPNRLGGGSSRTARSWIAQARSGSSLSLAGWVLWRFGWRHAIRFGAVALLVASPWIIRNAVNVGGPVLVTTNGFNLNATYSNEARTSHGFVDAYFDPRFAEMRQRASNEVDLDNQLRSKALRDLGRTRRGSPRCWRRTWLNGWSCNQGGTVTPNSSTDATAESTTGRSRCSMSLPRPACSRLPCSAGRGGTTPCDHRGLLHRRQPLQHRGSPPALAVRRVHGDRRGRGRTRGSASARLDHDRAADAATTTCRPERGRDRMCFDRGADHGSCLALRRPSIEPTEASRLR